MPTTNQEIRDLVPLLDGSKLRGFEVDFKAIKEEWDLYSTSDENTLKVKNILVKIFRVVDVHGNPAIDDTGDPIYYVNSTVTVAASKGLKSEGK